MVKNSTSTKNRDVGPGTYQIETQNSLKSFNIRNSPAFKYLFNESSKSVIEDTRKRSPRSPREDSPYHKTKKLLQQMTVENEEVFTKTKEFQRRIGKDLSEHTPVRLGTAFTHFSPSISMLNTQVESLKARNSAFNSQKMPWFTVRKHSNHYLARTATKTQFTDNNDTQMRQYDVNNNTLSNHMISHKHHLDTQQRQSYSTIKQSKNECLLTSNKTIVRPRQSRTPNKQNETQKSYSPKQYQKLQKVIRQNSPPRNDGSGNKIILDDKFDSKHDPRTVQDYDDIQQENVQDSDEEDKEAFYPEPVFYSLEFQDIFKDQMKLRQYAKDVIDEMHIDEEQAQSNSLSINSSVTKPNSQQQHCNFYCIQRQQEKV